MICKTFSESCKLLGTTPSDFSLFTGVPKKTLGTWFHTKPLLLKRLLESYAFKHPILNELDGPRQAYQNKPSAALSQDQ